MASIIDAHRRPPDDAWRHTPGDAVSAGERGRSAAERRSRYVTHRQVEQQHAAYLAWPGELDDNSNTSV